MRRFILIAMLLIFPLSLHSQTTRTFMLKKNSVSNIKFYTSNYGITFLDIARGVGGGYWPRNSIFQYIFGAGFWFAAQKKNENTGDMRKYVTISYNPNSGKSWFVPGRISDGNEVQDDKKDKYTIYLSTDFDENGNYETNDYIYNWPLWTYVYEKENQLGVYEPDTEKRNRSVYEAPVFNSDEDVFSTYKDTDLSAYEGGISYRQQMGYPLGIQVEERIFSWEHGDYKDLIVIYYDFINFSDDTLSDCYISNITDPDIATVNNLRRGALNDYINFYYSQDLKFAYSWSLPDDTVYQQPEMGYAGVSLIRTPAVDENGFLKSGGQYYPPEEQLGITTFKNWDITVDPETDDERYNYMSTDKIDDRRGPADVRSLLGTGPFHMLPGDTASFAVIYVFAMPSNSTFPDGSKSDIAGLINKFKNFDEKYYHEKWVLTKVNREKELNCGITNIYPMPASDLLNVELFIDGTYYCKIEILDLSGSVIYNEERLFNPGKNLVKFDNLNIASGIYFIKVSASSDVFTRKFTIVR